MSNFKGFDVLDFFILLIRNKKFLIITFVSSMIFSYLTIYFLVEEKFDSIGVIIPAESNDMSGISTLMKSFSNLPISIPGLSSAESTTDIYTTIIYSRSFIKKIIFKFNLKRDYKEDDFDKLIKAVRNNISAGEDDNNAYEITVRANSRQKSADMVNYIIDELNKSLIQLNTAAARENRMFLEKRYFDIKQKLEKSEEVLVKFQKTSGIIFAEQQAKSTLEAYTKLEAEVASKEIEFSILQKLFGEKSPQAQQAKMLYEEYKNKINSLKRGKDSSELLLSIDNLPEKAMNYLKYFSDIEINKTLMQFIIPLLEQAKFEEQKSIPIIQIIDKGEPPVKKSYPQRALFSLFISLALIIFIIIFIILKERIKNSQNEKIKYIVNNLWLFR